MKKPYTELVQKIRPASILDAEAICTLYNHFIRTSLSTFEEVEIDEMEMKARIEKILPVYPFIVAYENDQLIGYAYAGQWRVRSAYRFVAETSIYIHPDFSGQGWAFALYKSLLLELKNKNFKAAMGVITLPNSPSVNLHEKFGFVKAGHFSQVGIKFNQWCDVGYWQLNFEDLKV